MSSDMDEKAITSEHALKEVAAILEGMRRAADIIHTEPPGSKAAARAFRILKAARAELEK
jgi:hypothetical protein